MLRQPATAAQRVRRSRGSSHRRRPRRTPRAARPRRLRLLPSKRDRVIRSTTHRNPHRRHRQSPHLLRQALLRHRLARRLRRRSRRRSLRYRSFRPLGRAVGPAGGMAIQTTITRDRAGRGRNPRRRLPSPQRRANSRRERDARNRGPAADWHLPDLRERVRAFPVPGLAGRVPRFIFRPDRVRGDRPRRTAETAGLSAAPAVWV